MKKVVIIILLLTSGCLLNKIKAQNFSHNFGEITDAEKNLKYYKNDTLAGAVVIYDIGETSFEDFSNRNRYEIYFKRKSRIKIFSQSGLDYAEIRIPLYKGKDEQESIIDFSANTINIENGKIERTHVSKKNLFKEKISGNLYLVKIPMPNVKPGSIIDYQYEIRSPFLFQPPDWEFQRDIPTIFSKYTIKTIPFYSYTWILQGAPKVQEYHSYESKEPEKVFINVTYKEIVNEFIFKDIPALKDEPFISSINNYTLKLDFQLSEITMTDGITQSVIPTWKKFNKDLLKNKDFGKYIRKAKRKYKKVFKENKLKLLPGKERIKFIVNDIKEKYNWNGVFRYKANNTLKVFLKHKEGNSAEINLFLLGALKAAGVEAYPLILSTRKHGKVVKTYPLISSFNNVLVYCKVNNKFIFLDATDPYAAQKIIPSNNINGDGLIVRKRKFGWVNIRPIKTSLSSYNIELNLNDDELINGKFIFNYIGYEGLYKRNTFHNRKEDIEKYLSNCNFEEIDSIKTIDFNNTEKPYKISFSANIQPDFLSDKILISPFAEIFLIDNPLKQKKRKYPIDITYPYMKMFKVIINIPKKYKFEQLPEKYFWADDDIVTSYEAKKISKTKVLIKFTYGFKKSEYSASEYNKIKLFFSTIIKRLNQKVIVIKK